MSELTLSFTIQGDIDGYITFECPFCGSEFKLRADEFQSDEEPPWGELYCPYCGLSKETNNFYTSEVMEKAKAIATNYMIESLNKTFKTMRHSVNSSNGIIKMSYRPLKKVCVKELEDKDTVESIFECSCCNRHIKVLYCAGASKIFCSYCGVDL